VTDVGGVETVEPLIGDVVIKEFADAVAIPKKAKIAINPHNRFAKLILTLIPSRFAARIRANRLTSLDYPPAYLKLTVHEELERQCLHINMHALPATMNLRLFNLLATLH
jgi:hypothetical protein